MESGTIFQAHAWERRSLQHEEKQVYCNPFLDRGSATLVVSRVLVLRSPLPPEEQHARRQHEAR